MSEHWYTLHVKPHKERFVYGQLIAQELEAYLPLVKVNPVNPRAAKVRPWFPGYLFVRIDLKTEGVDRLAWIPGAHRLVSFDGEPMVVPDLFIRHLDERLTDIEIGGGMMLNKLEKGDTVKIQSGPFSGYEAIFDRKVKGNERVVVLMKFLNDRYQHVQLDAGLIERVKQ